MGAEDGFASVALCFLSIALVGARRGRGLYAFVAYILLIFML
jgi:hypothetical protein